MQPAVTETGEIYEILAIRYGTNAGRKRGANLILDRDPERLQPMDFYLWALRSPHRTIVVDTGMHPHLAAKHGHSIDCPPPEALRRVGIEPAQVECVALTHLHYDHIGNLDAFPNATFLLQQKEMEFVVGSHMEKFWFRRPYDAEEICNIVRLLHGGRLKIHAGDCQVAPGVSMHLVGGHTAGQEIVRVRTARGNVVLASDAVHYYEELDRCVPFTVVYSVAEMLDAHDRIRVLADSEEHIVPSHDPEVIVRYPAATTELSGLAVRVDLPPVSAART